MPDSIFEQLGVTVSPGLRAALGPHPTRVLPLEGGGNTKLCIVVDEDGSRRVVKAYSARGGSRAAREHAALAWLREAGVTNVPRSIFFDAQVGVLEYIEGTRPEPTHAAAVEACADFILRLSALDRTNASFGPASDARPTLDSYPIAIERRLDGLRTRAIGSPAERLVAERIEPLARRELARFAERVAVSGLDPERPLDRHSQIPSPSDFGLHNMIVDRYARLWFVDFEYFGWDDPAKLMADFRHSAANELPAPARERFIDLVAPSFEGARERLAVVSDLVRLEWLLIVLNVFSPERFARAEQLLEAFA